MCSMLLFCHYGGVYCFEICIYVLYCNDGWVSVDVCCVSSVVECGLFLELVSGGFV